MLQLRAATSQQVSVGGLAEIAQAMQILMVLVNDITHDLPAIATTNPSPSSPDRTATRPNGSSRRPGREPGGSAR